MHLLNLLAVANTRQATQLILLPIACASLQRVFKNAGITPGGATSATAILDAFRSAYGGNPHVACNKA